MALGAICLEWIAGDFLGRFIGFLITLGVPIAAWCGASLVDLLAGLSPGAAGPLLGLGPNSGPWTYANLGLLVAFIVGFLITYALSRSRVRGQEGATVNARS